MPRLKYTPSPVPDEATPAVKAFLANELRLISVALNSGVHVDVLGAAPLRASDGDIVYANGSDWNPGAGEGIYGRVNGAWVKL